MPNVCVERKPAVRAAAAETRNDRGVAYTLRSYSRRSFVHYGLASLAMIGAGLTAIGGRRAAATQRQPQNGYIEFRGAPRDIMEEIGPYRAYFARPQTEGPLAAIMVLHDNFGLNAHYEDITRRVADEGFFAFAPDMLSPLGGTPSDLSKARALFRQLNATDLERDLVAAVSHLNRHRHVAGPIACMGFGWGGTMAANLAVREKNLAAAVIFDGVAKRTSDVSKIRARLLLHYAGHNPQSTLTLPSYREALVSAGVDHIVYVYEGVDMGFHDETDDSRFNAEAAKLAWDRSIAFLRQTLKV